MQHPPAPDLSRLTAEPLAATSRRPSSWRRLALRAAVGAVLALSALLAVLLGDWAPGYSRAAPTPSTPSPTAMPASPSTTG